MAASYFPDDLVAHNAAPPAFHHAYQPLSPHATPPSTAFSSSFATDQPHGALPKLGQTRCYWALLSANLQFIYLDPVLAHHLDGQAQALVGQSLLAFVHPGERDTAKQDLDNVLNSKTLHGSVTRVRFSRLSKVQRDLGHRGPVVVWPEADKIALDDEYMAVEVVINWAADGLVLCFIHATVDLSPGDNDEQHKTSWTNWCGTPFMHQDQISSLFRRLLVCIPQTGTMNRVFQILSNNAEKGLLLSWPPDPSQLTEGGAEDFAKLVDTVNLGTGLSGPNDAKTSCTRRYKALHDIPTFGGEVESIFIPHGSIIFACHKVNPPSRGPVDSTASMQQLAYASSGYNSQAGSAFYDPNPYTLPPISTQEPYTYMPQHTQSSYSPQRWSQSIPSSMSNLRSNSYIQSPTPQEHHPWAHSGSQSAYADGGVVPLNGSRGPSPPYLYSPTGTSTSGGPSPTSDVVPPPRRRVSPSSYKDEPGANQRSQSNRPVGILKCSSCKATSSPEWRKGPSGKKELCNACGLRYARSRAKKEGQNQTQRRRKDKPVGTVKREIPVPPISTSPTYAQGGFRRSYGDGSFTPSSAVSTPGGDVYSHTHPHMLDNLSPSPSPPGSHLHFLHYSATNDNRAPYGNSPSYYAAPSSGMSNSSVSHVTEHSLPPPISTGHQQITQLPPISSYVNRLPSSPLTLASFASTIPASSFERERERDREYREMPSTPLSAEPRMKRSILSQQ